VAERLPGRDLAFLERALVDLGRALEFPPTPDLTARVRTGLMIPPRRRLIPWPESRLRRVAAAAVVIALIAALTLAFIPDAREAVADRFGLRGVRFLPLDDPLPAQPKPGDSAERGRLSAVGDRLAIGRPVSLAGARAAVNFPVSAPAVLGAPDASFTGAPPAGGQVTLLYGPREGLPATREPDVALILTVFRGETAPFIQKGLPAGARLTEVVVSGGRGYWIEGAPHAVIFRDSSGALREERSRLAGNTLLWERGGLTYRLESGLGQDDAIRIAESIP
jgi:hypothetical protein